MIKVKALGKVYYGNVLHKEGAVFEIADEKDFSKQYMEKVDKEDVPAKAAKPAHSKNTQKPFGHVESKKESKSSDDVI